MNTAQPHDRPVIGVSACQLGDKVRFDAGHENNKYISNSMQDYAAEKAGQLGERDGFILKKDAPSCGVYRVPVVINENGYRSKDGVGLFAKRFVATRPSIPVEEEGRLNDPVLR